MKNTLSLLFFSLCLTACSQKEPELIEPIPQDTIITVEVVPSKTLGCDLCRTYKVFVFADGLVVFDGIDGVGKIGATQFYISANKVRELVTGFQESDFFKLRDGYEIGDADCIDPVGHGLQVTLSIQLEGKIKTVSHYTGCPNVQGRQEPKTLYKIREQVEEVTGITKWVGRFAESKRNEVRRRF